MIGSLDLDSNKKNWMKYRWLDQASWFDKKARWANRWHGWLRGIAIVGGVLVPALISFASSDTTDSRLRDLARVSAFVVSLLVAALVGLDEFFHLGDRWLQYRRTAELLKIEGWLFIERAGTYSQAKKGDPNAAHRTHNSLFPAFAERVERLVRQDVEMYLTDVAQDQGDAST